MKYKAIIYDIDGTLMDTIAMNMYPLIRIVEEETGVKYTFDEIKHCFSMSGKQTLEYFNIDYERVYPRWVQYVNEYEQGAVPFAGVVTLLAEVKKRNVIQAACSAKTRKQYEIDMAKENLKDYMDETVLFEDTTKHKPDPEPILLAVKKLGLSHDEVIYVGDALADGLAAKAAGVDFAWAKWAGIEVKDMPSPKYICYQPLELLVALEDE